MRLKSEPEDFLVEELATKGFLASIEDSMDADYLVVRARKRDCAHFDMLRALSRRFKLPGSEIGVGGIKDRRAVTTQLVTLRNAQRVRDAFVSSRSVELDPATGSASVELLGSSRRRMSIGALFGNRFSIVARDLSTDERTAAESSAKALLLVVPNYFGRQRFGRDLENVELGYAILTGDFAFVRDTLLSDSDDDPLTFARRISRRKRMLMISAFQSAFFNAELVDRMRGGVLDTLRAASDESRVRSLARLADDRVYADSYAFSGPIPIVSLGSEVTPFQEELMVLLAFSPRSFAIRSMPDIMFEPVERESVIRVAFDRFELRDELRVSFELPKGSYATVVLDQLVQK